MKKREAKIFNHFWSGIMVENQCGHFFKIRVFILAFFLGGFFVSTGFAKSRSVDKRLDTYFRGLEKRIKIFSESKSVTASKLTSIDDFFRQILIDNVELTSILRTNSKGKVISEIARNKRFKRNYRSIGNQKIFKKIKKSGHPYYKAIKSKRGSLLLLWGVPINKSKRFQGILVVKYDLVNCLHQFAKSNRIPFLARANGKLIYSHLWEGRQNPMENFVDVPGVKEMIISFGGEKIVGVGIQNETASISKTVSQPEVVASDTPSPSIPAKSMTLGDSILQEVNRSASKVVSRNEVASGDIPRDSKPLPNVHEAKPMSVEEKARIPVTSTDSKVGKSYASKEEKSSPTMLYGIIGLVVFFVILGFFLAVKSKREEESIL